MARRQTCRGCWRARARSGRRIQRRTSLSRRTPLFTAICGTIRSSTRRGAALTAASSLFWTHSSTAVGPRQTTRPSTACTPRLNHDALHDASTQGTPRTTSLTPSWRGLRSDRRCLTERCSRTLSALFFRTTAAPSPPLHPRHRRPGPWVLPPRRRRRRRSCRRQPQHPPRRR